MHPSQLYELFTRYDLTFYAGVPDSLLKNFCAYVTDNTPMERNIIAANEGNAIALAAGYHLATGKIGVVYMQNSGLGNAVNPLTSLMDPEVYSIPVLLLIGWRAEPGIKDEPQHKKMGRIMESMLQSLEIAYSFLPSSFTESQEAVNKAVHYMAQHQAPYALIALKETFEPYSIQKEEKNNFHLNREQVLRALVPVLGPWDIIVSTTGKTSRELFELRKELGHNHERDFLTVGSMGHASSIAVGIALQKPNRTVYCIDGDGAFIMHMGALATIAKLQPLNFKHIVINNFAHDSVGGQPTSADSITISKVAQANGYVAVFEAQTEQEIVAATMAMKRIKGPVLLEVQCNKGARSNLTRPSRTPLENKKDFMGFLKS